MCDDGKYNGWPNYETFAYWSNNDVDSIVEFIVEMLDTGDANFEYNIAKLLEQDYEDLIFETAGGKTGLVMDLLLRSKNMIAWEYLAEKYLEPVDRYLEGNDDE